MFSKHHFETEGPLGLPMKDAQAKRLEAIVNQLPAEDRELVHLVSARPPSEVLAGERADVSWISTEQVDRDREIVVAGGMDESHFKLNPIVTLQHCYNMPPVGRSLWRKRARDGNVVGIKAKTQYPARPPDWTDPWPADTAFALVKAGLMNGKSIGFLRLKSHAPARDELRNDPAMAGVDRIIDEWLLLEYSCVFLPCNQAALVEEVSKGALEIPEEVLKIMNLKLAFGSPLNGAIIDMPFMTEDEIRHMVRRRLQVVDPQTLVHDAIQRAKGRV